MKNKEAVFLTEGFTNWKNALEERFRLYKKTACHEIAVDAITMLPKNEMIEGNLY